MLRQRSTEDYCLAIIERSSLVSVAFAERGQQILEAKPPYASFAGGFGDPPPPEQLIHLPAAGPGGGPVYWRNWTRDYDFLYVISADDAPNPVPQHLSLLKAGPHFQLYRINR